MISDDILQVFILVCVAQRFLRKSELPECCKNMNQNQNWKLPEIGHIHKYGQISVYELTDER